MKSNGAEGANKEKLLCFNSYIGFKIIMDLHKDIVSANTTTPEAFPGKFKKITEYKADFQCRQNRVILEANAIKNMHFRKRKSSPGFMALKDDTFF